MAQDLGTVVQGSNLDISQVPSEDVEQLATAIEQFYKMDGIVKIRLSYNWERNHRFLDGDQWIVFDGDRDTGGLWKRIQVSKSNEYIPRPVTNYIFDCYQTLKSYLLKNKPRSTIRPNNQNKYADKMAAKIGNLILEANWERLHEQDNYEYASTVLLTYGTVFKKSFWDSSAGNLVSIPSDQLDPETGQPAMIEMPLGEMKTEVVEPFRIALDPFAIAMHQLRWIMEYSIQPLEYVKEIYSKEEPGYTGLVEDLKPETSLSGSMRRFINLKSSSGVKNNTNIAEGNTTSSGDWVPTNSVILKEYYEKPCAKYPKGRLICVANGITLYAGESPCQGPEEGDWHPYSECRWELVSGRFWGKSPIDNAIEPQKRINSIDAVIALTRKTQAIPQRLIPVGAGITPGTWTGRPGQEIFYRGDQAPSTIPAGEVGSSVFQERAQCVDDIKTVTGAIDILKGDRPPGVNAASALNLLYEVGTGKLFPILDRWKKFVENDQKKQIKLIAKKYKEPREDFIKLLKSLNKDLPIAVINSFIGSDLNDNTNVVVEAGSNIPKLQAAKQAALQEAAATGILGLEQPGNKMEYLDQMGISGFDGDVGADVKRAEWENDLLDNIELSPDNKPIVLDVDNHDVHIEVLARAMKEPKFIEQSEAVQQAYMMHYQEHNDMKAKKEQQQMLQAMASGQPPQPQEDSSMQSLQPAGKGASKQAKSAMATDINIPGGAE